MKRIYFCTFGIIICLFEVLTVRVSAQTVSWSKVSGPYSGSIQHLTVDRTGNVFATTFAGREIIYRSSNQGKSWQQVFSPSGFGYEPALAADSSNNIYYGDYGSGLFESTDGGTSWYKTSLSGGATAISIISGDRLSAGGYLTLSISNDGGRTWLVSQVRDTTYGGDASSIAEDSSGNIYVGYYYVPGHGNAPPYGGGVFVSSDSGKTWRFSGLSTDSVVSMIVDKTGKVFTLGTYGIYSLASKSSIWKYDGAGIPQGAQIGALQTDQLGEAVIVTDAGILVYDDTNSGWRTVSSAGISGATITTAFYDPDGASYLGTANDGVYSLDKPSSSWTSCGMYSASVASLSLDASGSLFAGTSDGVFEQSTSVGGGWVRVSAGLSRSTVYQLYLSPSNEDMYAATAGGLFYLPDSGTYWTPLTRQGAYDFIETSMGDYAGSTGGILTSSSSVGGSWVFLQPLGLPTANVYCLAIDPSGTFFAGTSRSGVFVSTDSGSYWTQTGINSPLIFYSVKALEIDNEGRIFAGTDSSGAYYSDDLGADWDEIPSISGKSITCFLVNHGSRYFAGTSDRGAFMSTDHGSTWQPVNDGLTDSSVTSLTFDRQGYLCAATDSGIFRNTGVVLGVHSSKVLPSSFYLSQNYPNPFNPTTVISYQLSAVSHVTLSVYDVLGRKVATLVDEVKRPGVYQVEFEGSGLSSGVYFYRLVAGGYIKTRKMVLVK